MILRVYNRKTHRPLYSRRCLHWDHIKKREGLIKKCKYVWYRLRGVHKFDNLPPKDLCWHVNDLPIHGIPIPNAEFTGRYTNVVVTRTNQKA